MNISFNTFCFLMFIISLIHIIKDKNGEIFCICNIISNYVENKEELQTLRKKQFQAFFMKFSSNL